MRTALSWLDKIVPLHCWCARMYYLGILSSAFVLMGGLLCLVMLSCILLWRCWWPYLCREPSAESAEAFLDRCPGIQISISYSRCTSHKVTYCKDQLYSDFFMSRLWETSTESVYCAWLSTVCSSIVNPLKNWSRSRSRSRSRKQTRFGMQADTVVDTEGVCMLVGVNIARFDFLYTLTLSRKLRTAAQKLISCNVQSSSDGAIEVKYHARSGINSRADYEKMHQESLRDPAGFWGRMAEDFHWQTKVSFKILDVCRRGTQTAGWARWKIKKQQSWLAYIYCFLQQHISTQISSWFWQVCCGLQFSKDHVGWNFDLQKGTIGMNFFKGGKTNMSYNCLDRHVKRGDGDRVCFYWEGNEYDEDRRMTYLQVLQEVSRVVSLKIRMISI